MVLDRVQHYLVLSVLSGATRWTASFDERVTRRARWARVAHPRSRIGARDKSAAFRARCGSGGHMLRRRTVVLGAGWLEHSRVAGGLRADLPSSPLTRRSCEGLTRG